MSDVERWVVVLHGYDWIVEAEGKEDDENYIADCGAGDEAEAIAKSIVADHNGCLGIEEPKTTVPELVDVLRDTLEALESVVKPGVKIGRIVQGQAWSQRIYFARSVLAKTGKHEPEDRQLDPTGPYAAPKRRSASGWNTTPEERQGRLRAIQSPCHKANKKPECPISKRNGQPEAHRSCDFPLPPFTLHVDVHSRAGGGGAFISSTMRFSSWISSGSPRMSRPNQFTCARTRLASRSASDTPLFRLFLRVIAYPPRT